MRHYVETVSQNSSGCVVLSKVRPAALSANGNLLAGVCESGAVPERFCADDDIARAEQWDLSARVLRHFAVNTPNEL
jgi:hypothetical protein